MVFEVAQRRVTDTMAEIHDLLDANLDRLEQLYERGESITGVPTGFTDLDELLSGLQPNALIVVGARPVGRQDGAWRSAWPPTPRSRPAARCWSSRSR